MGYIKKYYKKTLLFLSVMLLLVFGFMLLIPSLFADEIEGIIKTNVNKNLSTNLHFSQTEVSFFKHFPALTLSLSNIKLEASAPFEAENMLTADELYFKINPFPLIFGKGIKVYEIALQRPDIQLKIDRGGSANYQVLMIDSDSTATEEREFFFSIDRLKINEGNFLFLDESSGLEIQAENFDFKGDGSIFSADALLASDVSAQSFKLSYNKLLYLDRKQIVAKLKTRYNNEALSFKFDKNKIVINDLPIDFTGLFSIKKQGYYLDFDFDVEKTDFANVFSALPPEFDDWKNRSSVSGLTSASVKLKGDQNSAQDLQPDLSIDFTLSKGQIKSMLTKKNIKDINLNGRFFLPKLDVDRMEIDLSNFSFTTDDNRIDGHLVQKNHKSGTYIDSEINGKMELQRIALALDIKDFEMEGVLDISITSKGNYDLNQQEFPVTKAFFSLEKALIKTPYYPNPIRDIYTKVHLNSKRGSFQDARLMIDTLNFSFEDETFTAKAQFEDFDRLFYKIEAAGNIDLAKLKHLFSTSMSDAQGHISADVFLSRHKSTNGSVVLEHRGNLQLKKIEAKFPNFPKSFLIHLAEFNFNNDFTALRNLSTNYGDSELRGSAKINNLIPFVLQSKQVLSVDIQIDTDFIDLNDFVPTYVYKEDPNYNPAYLDTTNTNEYGVFVVPDRINLLTDFNAKHLVYDSINVYNTRAKLQIKDQSITIVSAQLDIIDANASMTGTYKALTPTQAFFDYRILLDNFDIYRAYQELPLFRKLVPAAAYTEGISALDYKISGILDGNMTPILPSLEGSGNLWVKEAKIKNYKLLSRVSKSSGNTAFENAVVYDIQIPTQIADNIMQIDRFRMRSRGFYLRTQGEVRLDGLLNLNMRIGLPPFGIIGIPVKITGEADDPSIKLGKTSKDLAILTYEDFLKMRQDSTLLQSLDSTEIKLLQLRFEETLLKDSLEVDSM
ncbi:MAG: AsmA-like C-terminal region-containing protein [Flavobacteriaceae bacterium]|nr:AsmA-like C-terminal region-containing protein [Flavobacteriaceae bacterium]